jgi:Domain of unknown function (DUF4062)
MNDAPKPTDRRYQIFISSTFEDLRAERKAAVEAVFERGHIPIALENFSPSNESDLQVIKRALKDCQVYVAILGHRYGSMVPGKNFSFTEFEYDLAQEYGLKTLTFILTDDVINERRSKLDPKSDAVELGNFNKLKAFHNKVTTHFRKLFTPSPAFKYIVELALGDDLNRWDKPGWVREPEDRTILDTAKNEFIVDIIKELEGFPKLYERCSEKPEEKRALARFFTECYFDDIRRNQVSLFFESGSTVAFVAKEVSKHLKGYVTIGENGAPNLQISTNNILAYLLLWLVARVPSTQFPWSPPEERTYGASYGGIDKNLSESTPDYSGSGLTRKEEKEIEKLLHAPFSLLSMKRPTLLLGASSGLQISEQHQLKFPEDISSAKHKELEAQLACCFGPHVGSYHNTIFKRFMYATKLPLVIFLTADKIDCEIEVGKCHFILDSTFTWQQFCREHPVAFCVGCGSCDMDRYIDMFRQLGFEIKRGQAFRAITSFIARNAAFIDQFERGLEKEQAFGAAG